jgi:hypothetical protein
MSDHMLIRGGILPGTAMNRVLRKVAILLKGEI